MNHVSPRDSAARTIAPHTERLRDQVLLYLQSRDGATDEETAIALGMRLDTARARRCELRDAGLVRDSGHRRKTTSGHDATVWAVAGALSAASVDGRGRSLSSPDDVDEPVPDAHPPQPQRRSGGAGCLVAKRPLPGQCPWCRQFRWWQRPPDKPTCANCHPPAVPKGVIWIDHTPSAIS